MLSVALLLVQTSPDTGGGGGLLTLYYVAGCVLALLGLAEAGRRIYNRQKRRWTEEGESRAHQARVMEENNEQLKGNTNAIAALTIQLGEFITTSRRELDGLGHRISSLEEFRSRWRDSRDSTEGTDDDT